MRTTTLAAVVILLAGAILPASSQDRTWTDIEGREIVARAIAKDEKKVQLRLTNRKIVSVPLQRLSKKDLGWLSEWNPPSFSISARKRDFKGYFGVGEVREFKFRAESRMEFSVFEDEIPNFIKALHEFLELAKGKWGQAKLFDITSQLGGAIPQAETPTAGWR